MDKIRYLQHDIQTICFDASKMAFISGPRQCGKTTMAKSMLHQRKAGEYCNWDEVKLRRLWAKDPSQIITGIKQRDDTIPLIILDELHKAKGWKRNLKGVFDTLELRCDILVTGSARLNVYRKGSDSLLGRYYHFRLHPFSLAELCSKTPYQTPDNMLHLLFSKEIKTDSKTIECLQKLRQFGSFPEPYLAADMKRLNLWQRNRIEKIVREDLRDLSRLPELSQVEMLVSLLPERVAQPLSMRSLAEDLEVSVPTIKRWLNYLNALYYCYVLKPYSKSLKRSIKKEGKLYLWDWSEVLDSGARFENLIAGHLLKYCHYLTDTGVGKFELFYLKNVDKQEIDFLITRNSKPWLPIEAKESTDSPSSNWKTFLSQLPCKYAIQVVQKNNIYKKYHYDEAELLIISADKFLNSLV